MKFLIAFLNKIIAARFMQAILGILPAKEKRLCAELLWMAYQDQKVRKAWAESTKYHTVRHLKHMIHLDLSHTARMKQIIAKHGWPGDTLVGPMGSQAAWLMVQHADHDRVFQKHCLDLLEGAVEKNEASPSYLAYLTDRTRIHDGQPQIFGTQFDGSLNPFPIEDPDHVDERRANVGLPPLTEYIAQIKQAFANQPSFPSQITEIKQLVAKLPSSPEYDTYIAEMKRQLNLMNAS